MVSSSSRRSPGPPRVGWGPGRRPWRCPPPSRAGTRAPVTAASRSAPSAMVRVTPSPANRHAQITPKVNSEERNRRSNRSATTPFIVLMRIFSRPLTRTDSKNATQSTSGKDIKKNLVKTLKYLVTIKFSQIFSPKFPISDEF